MILELSLKKVYMPRVFPRVIPCGLSHEVIVSELVLSALMLLALMMAWSPYHHGWWELKSPVMYVFGRGW